MLLRKLPLGLQFSVQRNCAWMNEIRRYGDVPTPDKRFAMGFCVFVGTDEIFWIT